MVGWSRRARESSERAAAWAAKNKACVDGGCHCFCHEPKPEKQTPWLLIIIGLLLVCLWWVPLALLTQSDRRACEKTETCEVCKVTSTGFPYDCVPDPKFGKNVTIRKDSKENERKEKTHVLKHSKDRGFRSLH